MCRVVCIMYAHRYVHVFVWIKFVCVCRYCALLHVCVYILCTCVQFVSACVGVCVFGEVGVVVIVYIWTAVSYDLLKQLHYCPFSLYV